MTNTSISMILATFVIFLVGCGASTPKASAPPSADAAWNKELGVCDQSLPGARREDWLKCVELSKKGSVPAPMASAPTTLPTVPPGVPTAPMGVAVPPPPVLTDGAFVFATGGGPSCDVPGGKTLTIFNYTTKMVEVQSDYLAPLKCDAVSSLVPAGLAAGGGKVRPQMVIPPALGQGKPSSATFVFGYRVFNGALTHPPDVRVVYVTYNPSLGPFVAAPPENNALRFYKLAAVEKGYNQTLFGGDFGYQ